MTADFPIHIDHRKYRCKKLLNTCELQGKSKFVKAKFLTKLMAQLNKLEELFPISTEMNSKATNLEEESPSKRAPSLSSRFHLFYEFFLNTCCGFLYISSSQKNRCCN